MFFKYVFKAWVAVYLVTHVFDITMAVFDVGQHLVNSAAGVISSDTAIDVESTLAAMTANMETMEVPELLLLVMETALVSMILSRLVDTFSSRILYPMLLLSGNHSIAAVLSWEEGLH